MQLEELKDTLGQLKASSDDILLAILVSADGLPIIHIGEGLDFDEQGALFFEMKAACDRVLAALKKGNSEEMFIRSREGCITIWPVGDMVFACLAKPTVNAQRLQILTWKTISRLNAML